MFAEECIMSLVYNILTFIQRPKKGENPSDFYLELKHFQEFERLIVWPNYDLFASLSMLYLIYCLGKKNLEKRTKMANTS